MNLVRSWRQLGEADIERLLHDPWEFKAFANSIAVGPAKAMRETLYYLIFPDSFEPIVSLDHKKRFAAFFADLAPGIDDLDQRLLAIHRALAETHGSFASFYDPKLEALMGAEPAGADEDGAAQPAVRQVWWVNQGATYATERAGGYLWAPQKNKAGNPEAHWTNMTRVQAGDVVVHYANTAIRALSVATASAIESDKPGEMANEPWQKDGWLVSVEIVDLSQAVPLLKLPEAARPAGEGPLTSAGNVKQGYLWEVPSAMAAALEQFFGEQWPGGDGAGLGGEQHVERHPIYQSIADKGFSFPEWLVTDYLLSLATKPFVLLSGISGTGKTKLAQLVAEQVAPPEDVLEVASGPPEVGADSFVARVGLSTLRYGVTVPQREAGLFPNSSQGRPWTAALRHPASAARHASTDSASPTPSMARA